VPVLLLKQAVQGHMRRGKTGRQRDCFAMRIRAIRMLTQDIPIMGIYCV